MIEISVVLPSTCVFKNPQGLHYIYTTKHRTVRQNSFKITERTMGWHKKFLKFEIAQRFS